MEHHRYKVSVTIPIYNVERYLEKCVLSLLNQTLNDIELIFIDDCSSDESFATLKSLIQQHHLNENIHVKLLQNTENKGVASTRNVGLNASEGKYLAAVDPDDYVSTDMFKLLYEKAEADGSDIVWCDYIHVYDNKQEVVNQRFSEDPIACVEGLVSGALFGGMSNKLIARDLFLANNIKFPDGLNMSEDLRVCVQLFYFAKKVSYLNSSLYYYIQYRNLAISQVNIKTFKVNKEWFENIKGIESFLKKMNLENLLPWVMRLKLISKTNLLVKGKSVENFKTWRNIFPESNEYIQDTDLPWHYKFIAGQIVSDKWLFPRLWIRLKELLKK